MFSLGTLKKIGFLKLNGDSVIKPFRLVGSFVTKSGWAQSASSEFSLPVELCDSI
jgi:hypothetical protein